MYLNIVFLPLLGSLVAGFFGRFLGGRGAGLVTISCICLSFFLSGLAFYEVGLGGSSTYLYLMPWLECDSFHVDWAFCFDSLTVVMLIVVTFISTLVHLYSTEYMGGDPHLPRFMSYLSLFTFFMLILVTADNFVQMFVGWEGVGLCSYLLINFWFTRIQANKAAIKAMLVNRVGDFGLALGIFGIFICFGAVDYATVFALAPQLSTFSLSFFNVEFGALNFIGILLFVGAVGKSAQLGLHTWLPDAMEGPTPVSALIHAATMVTAGVFLLARCSPLLEYCPEALTVISIVGGMTAFFAATTALVQNDLKRVIAYSTCSQLGYMVFACGLSNYSVAVFHLGNHAFFKALLFLGAGSVIHAVGDEQDMRKMGGLRRLLPFTYAMMVIGSLALMGMPFLTGFYSKDVILEVGYATYSNASHFAYWLGSLAAFCTAFYSIRLLALCFLSEPNGSRSLLLSASEGGWPMGLVLGILALPSMFIGYLGRDLFIGLGTDFWGNALFCMPSNLSIIDAEFMSTDIKLLPLCCSIIGGLASFILYNKYNSNLFLVKTSFIGRKFYTFLNRKWLFDKVYNEVITQNLLDFGYHFTYKSIDRGLIESLGPFGISNVLADQVNKSRAWHSGYLYHYLVILGWCNFLFGIFFVFGFQISRVFALLTFIVLWSIL
uniref:NADH-ubiquinone oxidoreductase chain 5 n=2 Tax=Saccharina TaxID=309357 RepID=F8UWN3_9PHAE|nr:NADH dehydrogenase subunit 5 [Saccharina japonica x Saccharina latissima]APZ83020.1 NADH dehydrogenase subunit 5 [Saccharina japonica]AEH43386.1 NADH dehydrogenase subunit 5 [Saccharina japonica x Saccharina latissima]QBA19465.1 NADH dehydrogenase subunit 5 [Saccharina japonica x Saccharina latissima]QIA95827.1 NADH dehydrogenase subunit 5 [Saccharina japonica x Saccharina latissima]QIA95865.1 NADH dehydrogenase subunit 5 [Saccharina japonica x Saccharina latissima]